MPFAQKGFFFQQTPYFLTADSFHAILSGLRAFQNPDLTEESAVQPVPDPRLRRAKAQTPYQYPFSVPALQFRPPVKPWTNPKTSGSHIIEGP